MEEKQQSNRRLNLLRILIAVFIILFLFFLLVPHRCPTKKQAIIIVCKAKLHQLFVAVSSYKEDNQKFPSANRWCDILKIYYEDTEILKCYSDKIGPCSYAMNENIPADVEELPGDLVLLFESAPGWNQVGGTDDVVTDRHSRPGANIAFADGHVEFVEAEDIPNLRWTIEE